MAALGSSGSDEDAYSRISIVEGSDIDSEAPLASQKLLTAMALREKYAALNQRQLRWTFDGQNAFNTESLPPASAVRQLLSSGKSLPALLCLWLT